MQFVQNAPFLKNHQIPLKTSFLILDTRSNKTFTKQYLIISEDFVYTLPQLSRLEGLRQASKFVGLNFNRAPSLTCPLCTGQAVCS